MSKQKLTSWVGCATPNVSRSSQPKFNPAPGASPEAIKAAQDAKASALKPPEKKDLASVARSFLSDAFSTAKTATKQGATQSAGALADRKDQAEKLRGEY